MIDNFTELLKETLSHKENVNFLLNLRNPMPVDKLNENTKDLNTFENLRLAGLAVTILNDGKFYAAKTRFGNKIALMLKEKNKKCDIT